MVLYYGFSCITLYMLFMGFFNTGWLWIKIFIVLSIISVIYNIRYIVNIPNLKIFYYIGHTNYVLCVFGTILMLIKSVSGYMALYLLCSELYHIVGICKVMYVWIKNISIEYHQQLPV